MPLATSIHSILRALGFASFFLSITTAQSCTNYGIASASSCLCPPGFGGANCSQPGCGGTIFDGSHRSLTPSSVASGGFPNLTSSGCSCANGWTGVGCNVCTSASACQAAYAAVSGNASSATAQVSGLNDTMVCNTSPMVWAAGELSCQVNNPTLQAIYPLQSTLNIHRTLNASLSPLQNVSGTVLSPNGSPAVYAQLFYSGVEQFACTASSCTQTSTNTSDTLDLFHFTVSMHPKHDVLWSSADHRRLIRLKWAGTAKLCFWGTTGSSPLSPGVIAGLAVVGGLIGIGLVGLIWGWILQRSARKRPFDRGQNGGVDVRWTNVSYFVRSSGVDKTILDSINGHVAAGELMTILGPSGAGKTTLVELIAGKAKSGLFTGSIAFPSLANGRQPRVAFVPQTDVLPAILTVREALTFAASLRLPESLSPERKAALVSAIISRLGLEDVAETRIGATDGTGRGISGGEARRVSIGLELDSVSARRVVNVLKEVARGGGALFGSVEENNQGVRSHLSRLYHTFDSVLLLSRGRALYSGSGGLAPARHFTSARDADIRTADESEVPPYEEGYNVADYLLEIASAAPAGSISTSTVAKSKPDELVAATGSRNSDEKINGSDVEALMTRNRSITGRCAATFLTQFQVLCGREWKLLRRCVILFSTTRVALWRVRFRDKSLFFTHLIISAILGVFCGAPTENILQYLVLRIVVLGGLYFQTGLTIAGFQSRIGCLFFLGSLIAFSSLSALYNIVEIRPLFVRERSNSYYSPTAWLLSRFFFDVIPLRILPTIIVSTITYWMAGLAHDPAHFFKFLFILVLYTLVMTIFNFLLATLFHNGGIAILISALTALYQMTYAGFFVHLTSIPPVLRWLQWLCPLKYTLEALSVNEVGSGLVIEDVLQGVPVNISASLIMQMLFGFDPSSYYRDVLVLFGFIAGFGIILIGVVWLKLKEKR
ncbi:ABC-2 type transporter-domain-containing protein [Lanmaoa asiatica]|nr:ABC-2 type transporter-domain-containing protein [Lanmaoa asiatica]